MSEKLIESMIDRLVSPEFLREVEREGIKARIATGMRSDLAARSARKFIRKIVHDCLSMKNPGEWISETAVDEYLQKIDSINN